MSLNISEGYNLENLEAIFREFLIIDKVAPITLKNYLSDLRHFLGWLTFHIHSDKQHDNINEQSQIVNFIDFRSIESYKSYLESNKLPLSTINRRLSTLRKFCTLCVKQGWMKENPAKQVANKMPFEKKQIYPVKTIHNPLPHGDMLGEFKQYLIKTESNPKEVSLVLEDIHEFLTIIS